MNLELCFMILDDVEFSNLLWAANQAADILCEEYAVKWIHNGLK